MKKGRSTIPAWRKPPVDVPVQALREFIAKYGADVSVLVTWTEATKTHQFLTIGSNVGFANAAVRLRNLIASKIGLKKLGPTTEDLRGDHPNVSLNPQQLDFLLWLLGRIYATVNEEMDPQRRNYILEHHDALLELLGVAREKLVNRPE